MPGIGFIPEKGPSKSAGYDPEETSAGAFAQVVTGTYTEIDSKNSV